MLEENVRLIHSLMAHQRCGAVKEASELQQMLHRNLIYLATIADRTAGHPSNAPPLPNQTAAQSGPPTVVGVPSNGPIAPTPPVHSAPQVPVSAQPIPPSVPVYPSGVPNHVTSGHPGHERYIPHPSQMGPQPTQGGGYVPGPFPPSVAQLPQKDMDATSRPLNNSTNAQ